mmetsp:Transcript_6195/g.15059  ORF Transcript_6195/g.15059 Transcript_6195/m.15059 type:complete len:227 (-) Transcript_6195:121-801(-)
MLRFSNNPSMIGCIFLTFSAFGPYAAAIAAFSAFSAASAASASALAAASAAAFFASSRCLRILSSGVSLEEFSNMEKAPLMEAAGAMLSLCTFALPPDEMPAFAASRSALMPSVLLVLSIFFTASFFAHAGGLKTASSAGGAYFLGGLGLYAASLGLLKAFLAERSPRTSTTFSRLISLSKAEPESNMARMFLSTEDASALECSRSSTSERRFASVAVRSATSRRS